MPSIEHIDVKEENELRREFYESFLPRVDSSLDVSNVLSDFSDGIVRGTILEFKRSIKSLNAVLLQAIKYLSSRRIKGKPVPSNILLVSFSDHKAYLYHSGDFLDDIEKVYFGPSSQGNDDFEDGGKLIATYDYTSPMDAEKIINILRKEEYTRIHIDENCIVGWATTFYHKRPKADKASFIGDKTGKVKIVGEIRQPDVLKDYILPYEGKDNDRFRYLMDMLNADLNKKDLGAFYTDRLYARKALELVRAAIKRVEDAGKKDYIILDRCAGTGNLEQDMTNEELSHVIVSTVEYYEYKVLSENFGDKARVIIPPYEADDTFNKGMVRGADALSEDYVNNPVIRQYIDDPDCAVILFENPPFTESTSAEHQRRGAGRDSSAWKDSFVVREMKKAKLGRVINDKGNAFIWSAFQYYLRQPTDSYIVFSPPKYWKVQHLVEKKFLGGYAFNRKFFHRKTEATIMVANWSNIDDADTDEFIVEAWNIVDGKCFKEGNLPIRKVHSTFSQKYYDKTVYPEEERKGIYCSLDGTERATGTVKPLTDSDVIGYLVAHSSGFDNPDLDSSLLVATRYDGHGFYLRKDNFLEKLPMFVASRFYANNREWTMRGRINKSGDGFEKYSRDVRNGKLRDFLLRCLLFTCLEKQNHMRIFMGFDGKKYVNQLCLDNSNGNTLATETLKAFMPNEDDRELLNLWNKILKEAKETSNYDTNKTYGIFQIDKELNTSRKDDDGTTVYDYPGLNGDLKTIAVKLKGYYNKYLLPTLFEYEFLK
ncbi:MAG: hypothetical protein PUF37_00920 [Prevotellaceae bacterium]|nr:hypothetical protein [Prevotellaceae bacterium]